MNQIHNLDELKELAAAGEPVECFLRLNAGARSSKTIQYWEDGIELDSDDADNIDEDGTMDAKWLVLHEISDSWEAFETDEDLLTQTNIGTAMVNGAFHLYNQEPV